MLVGHERSIKHLVWAREVGLDSGRVARAMEVDKESNPAAISLHGADAIVFDPAPVPDPFEQRNRWNRPHRTTPLILRIANHSCDSEGLSNSAP